MVIAKVGFSCGFFYHYFRVFATLWISVFMFICVSSFFHLDLFWLLFPCFVHLDFGFLVFSFACSCCQTRSFLFKCFLVFIFMFMLSNMFSFHFAFWAFVSRSVWYCPSVALCCLMFVSCVCLHLCTFKLFLLQKVLHDFSKWTRYIPWSQMNIPMKILWTPIPTMNI